MLYKILDNFLEINNLFKKHITLSKIIIISINPGTSMIHIFIQLQYKNLKQRFFILDNENYVKSCKK